MNGYQNEFDFINELNDQKYKDVNILLQELIKVLYPKIENNDLINASKY